MTNYEKAMILLKNGIARKHGTFKNTGYICIDLGEYCGYISPRDKYVDVAEDVTHVSWGNIDIVKMMVLDTSNRHSYDLPIKKWEDVE